jgi:hypothetical protein
MDLFIIQFYLDTFQGPSLALSVHGDGNRSSASKGRE